MKNHGVARLVWHGAVAGVVGTIAMTVPILVARRFGLLTTPPPVEISTNVARHVQLLPEQGQRGFSTVWVGGHLAYGAVGGVVFAFSPQTSPSATVPAGLLFGSVVWAASYLGVVPALGLYPEAEHDRRSRLLVMVLAHGIYGVTVSGVNRILNR